VYVNWSERPGAATAVPAAADVAASTAADDTWRTERRSYGELCDRKREALWRTKVDAERLSPRQLWQSIDVLMGRGHSPKSAAVDACDLHRYFDDKVAHVRAATDGAQFRANRLLVICFQRTERRRCYSRYSPAAG